jgi:hypothetical protein
MAFSVDEAIAEQLASNDEISAPEVPIAVSWLSERFFCADGLPGSGMGSIFLGRFDNDSDEGFVIYGAGWRGTVKRDMGALKLMSVTRSDEAIRSGCDGRWQDIVPRCQCCCPSSKY